jgi:hypothetical protein
MRPRCFFRENIGAERDGTRSSLRRGARGTARTDLRVGSDRRREPSPSGRGKHRRRSQTRPRLLAFLDFSGRGRRSGWHRKAKRPARKRLGGATARQHPEIVVDPKPMGASSGATPKGGVAATDSSVEKGPEVDGVEGAAWRHASGSTSNGERARQSVNAAELERARRGDGMAGCRGGERFVGSSLLGKTLRTFGSTTSGSTVGRKAEPESPKRSEPHGRLRGATNPRAVERMGSSDPVCCGENR